MRIPKSASMLVAALLGCLAGLVGCRPGQAPSVPRVGAGGTFIGATKPVYGTWGEAIAVVVWFDRSSGSSGVSVAEGSVTYSGLSAPPGRSRIEWRCDTSDGRTGVVRIDGQQYDLSKGAIFLVSTKGGRAEVQQLQRDLARFKPGHDGLEELAKEDAEVARFAAEAGEPGRGPP